MKPIAARHSFYAKEDHKSPADKRILVKLKQPLEPIRPKLPIVDYDQIRKGKFLAYIQVVMKPEIVQLPPAKVPVKKVCRSCEQMQDFVASLQLEIRRLQFITTDLQK